MAPTTRSTRARKQIGAISGACTGEVIAMTRLSVNASGITANGLYCEITGPPQGQFLTPGQPISSLVISASFYAFANTSATGGVIQPIIYCVDRTWRAYGAPTTITAAGFLFLTSLVTPVLGVGIQITSPVTGSSVYLECVAVIS